MYIGLMIGFYGSKEWVNKLFCTVFSLNLLDELLEIRTSMDWISLKNNIRLFYELFIIFVVGFYNYKNLQNERN